MDSVRKAKTRLKAYPKLISQCGPEAAAYAQCVSKSMGEVRKHQCQTEFEAFKKCVQSAATKAKTKL